MNFARRKPGRRRRRRCSSGSCGSIPNNLPMHPGARPAAVHQGRAGGGRSSRAQCGADRADRCAIAQSHGHDHDRGAAAPGRRAPLPPSNEAHRQAERHPPRQSRLEPQEPGANGRVAGALRGFGPRRPGDLPDPLRLGPDGGDRSQLRPRRRTARCGGGAIAGKPERLVATRDPEGAHQGLRQRAGGARRHRAAARGRRPRADRSKREGSPARQNGALRGRLRRLHRSQAHASRAHRSSLPGGGGGGAGPAAQGLLRRAAAQNPAARRDPVRRRPADLHRRLSPFRHDDDRADA